VSGDVRGLSAADILHTGGILDKILTTEPSISYPDRGRKILETTE
jgi:hypothetical protein